jgi:hypothetical protein
LIRTSDYPVESDCRAISRSGCGWRWRFAERMHKEVRAWTSEPTQCRSPSTLSCAHLLSSSELFPSFRSAGIRRSGSSRCDCQRLLDAFRRRLLNGCIYQKLLCPLTSDRGEKYPSNSHEARRQWPFPDRRKMLLIAIITIVLPGRRVTSSGARIIGGFTNSGLIAWSNRFAMSAPMRTNG